ASHDGDRRRTGRPGRGGGRMIEKHDLEFEKDFCASRYGMFRYFGVYACSIRGQMFIDAYWQATDRKTGGDEEWDEDRKQWLPESLHIAPEDFEGFRKQASLAGVTMREAALEPDEEIA